MSKDMITMKTGSTVTEKYCRVSLAAAMYSLWVGILVYLVVAMITVVGFASRNSDNIILFFQIPLIPAILAAVICLIVKNDGTKIQQIEHGTGFRLVKGNSSISEYGNYRFGDVLYLNKTSKDRIEFSNNPMLHESRLEQQITWGIFYITVEQAISDTPYGVWKKTVEAVSNAKG